MPRRFTPRNDSITLPLGDVAFLCIRIAGMSGKSSYSVITLFAHAKGGIRK
ncbi:MAG: hypothetical protein K9G11_00390 [Rickettsiaceae bacterium]|nr:hypothetical protein [Rickettsiaceae bacterium]